MLFLKSLLYLAGITVFFGIVYLGTEVLYRKNPTVRIWINRYCYDLINKEESDEDDEDHDI